MAYRKPGVTVTQEFADLIPALAQFNLPSVAVGPAYQLVNDDELGTYSASQQAYPYASLQPGAQVDLERTSSDEQFPATKKEIQVFIREALVKIVPEQMATGEASNQTFTDPTANIFSDVIAGDILRLVEKLNQIIVPNQTDGEVNDTDPDILTAGTNGLFEEVAVDDSVEITGGTSVTQATYTVVEKIDSENIRLGSNFYTGSGSTSDVEYSIEGERAEDNKGDYVIKEKIDDNTLEVQSPFPEQEGSLTYKILREVSEIELDRVDSFPNNGFLATDTQIELPATLTTTIDGTSYDIAEGNVEANYRALRNDLAANVRSFSRLSDVQAFFGPDQITPANPLAFALTIMLQNTVTQVNGLGLDGNAQTDEVLSYTNAFDVLTRTEMYAIAPLTHNPAVHQLLSTHVNQLSQPERKKERAGIINRLLVTTETLVEETTTSTDETGARSIVSTQTDGAHDGSSLDTLTDPTTDQFIDVLPGDTVVITGGTDVTTGSYTVDSKTDNNTLVLASDFAQSGGGASDVEYFIVRKDGLGANGTTFYDRNGSFISDGVAPGMYLVIKSASNSLAVGRHKITAVTSNLEFEVEQVNGITSLVTDITYEVERDLTLDEQASFLEGYSSSIGNRRIVNLWPDVLEAPVGSQVRKLPGYFGSVAIAALTTGLPTQQGFTNLSITGFLGFEHSNGYFTDVQLNTIANGGTMILAQDVEEAPLFVRHQLTTDRSSIKFQEYSVTKNVDFIAKFTRDQYSNFIGQYNIVDTTLDELRSNAQATIDFLREDTRLPRIGGAIRSGKLVQLAEDETQIDTVNMRFNYDIPIPLNNLDITIQV